MKHAISTRIEPLAHIFLNAGWNLPIQLVRAQTFPYTASKQFRESMVHATVDWDRKTAFADITFEWDDEVGTEKSKEVIRRLIAMYG